VPDAEDRYIRREAKKAKPRCFGVFRSPQSDAENDCDRCDHDEACDQVVRYKRATGADSGRS